MRSLKATILFFFFFSFFFPNNNNKTKKSSLSIQLCNKLSKNSDNQTQKIFRLLRIQRISHTYHILFKRKKTRANLHQIDDPPITMKKFMVEIKLSPDVTSSSSVESALTSSISGIDSSSLSKTTDRMTNQIILSVSFSTSSPTFDIYDLQDDIEELSDDIVSPPPQAQHISDAVKSESSKYAQLDSEMK